MKPLLLPFILLPVCALAQEKPNIIVILSDDMGFTDLGCYGGEIHTPNLDMLAENGLRFTQFYNTGRSCPTRASLITGLYQHQAAIGGMVDDNRRDLSGYRGDLGRECVTISEALKTANYKNYMVGKWHLTPCPTSKKMVNSSKHNWPLQRGFDRFYGTIQGAGSFWNPNGLARDNEFISPFNDAEYQPEEKYYYTHAISDHAIRYIKEHDDSSPFFMYVAYTAAHWPMHAPENEINAYNGVYDVGYDPIRQARYKRAKELGVINDNTIMSEQAGDWTEVEHKLWEARLMQTYAAMVTIMDRGIGHIVETLRKEGKLENTLIFFLQDNGGCAENIGRVDKKPNIENNKVIPKDQPQWGQWAGDWREQWLRDVTRDDRPVRRGPSAMPGPEDTFIAYGKAWANVSNTPFREYKQFLHEGGISTPLIAHWPKGISKNGELRHTPGHLIDIMATCVDAAGAKYPEVYADTKIQSAEGESLLPIFKKDSKQERIFFFEHIGNAAIRKGDWKLVGKRMVSKRGIKQTGWELYNIAEDRSEQHDLSAKYPVKAKELLQLFEEEALRVRAVPSPR